MNIAIVGAGVGGLTAALCLAKSGHQITVLEQSAEFCEVGAGLQCGANAVRVFQYLGLQQALEEYAVKPEAVEFRQWQSGSELYNVALGQCYENKYGAPYYHLHRADLLQVLVDEVSKTPNINVVMSASLRSYIERDATITLNLADGGELAADLLVGCDGIKSQVRSQLIGDTEPRFTGNVAWRAIVPVDRLPQNFMRKVVTNFVGPKKHMVMYYLRSQQLLNMVGVVERNWQQSDSWVAQSPWSEFASDFAGWHPMVDAAIQVVDKDQCYRWALYDHKPLNNWHSRRVTLLGDAAHATLPFMASGAAMAIEDARVLQRSLDQMPTIEKSLALYQRNRINRTTKIQNTSRKFGTLYHITNPFLLWAAFSGLRVLGGKKEDFLPEYDANTVELF